MDFISKYFQSILSITLLDGFLVAGMEQAGQQVTRFTMSDIEY